MGNHDDDLPRQARDKHEEKTPTRFHDLTHHAPAEKSTTHSPADGSNTRARKLFRPSFTVAGGARRAITQASMASGTCSAGTFVYKPTDLKRDWSPCFLYASRGKNGCFRAETAGDLNLGVS